MNGSFLNEFIKLASAHEEGPLNKGHALQMAKNLGVIGLGTAAGYGLGWLAGRKYVEAGMPGRSHVPKALALGGALAAWATARRSEHGRATMNEAGRRHAEASRHKHARLLAPRSEWSPLEDSTIKGAGVGALAGIGATGVLSSITGHPRYIPAAVLGGIAGGIVGRKRTLKRYAEQGYDPRARQ